MPVRETVHVDQRIPATPEMSGNTRFAASSKWTTALVLAVELRFLGVKKLRPTYAGRVFGRHLYIGRNRTF